jgi:hypothetical protein
MPLSLWGQVSFTAICDHSEVAVGQRFEVSFQLRNAKERTFTPPSINGFQSLGTSQGYSTSFSNGQSNVISTVTYTLLAKREGKFKIGAAEVLTAKGKVLRTKPIQIKVVAADKAPKPKMDANVEGKMFVKTIVNDTTPIIGTQVTVDIKIYTQINIEQLEITRQPTFKDFFSHHVRSFNAPKQQEKINGKTYTTMVLRRLVVFPSKSGELIIDPAQVQVSIPVNGGQSLFNPFYQSKNYTLTTNPVKLQVRALDGAPAGFSGLVGKFRMLAHANKNTITSDDVIQLQLRIEGKGDIKQILAPNLGVNEKYFDQFAPNSNEELREVGGVLGGTKYFEYVLTPKVVGSFDIHPKFIYFDPSQKKFITVDTTIQITIKQGNNKLPTIAELDQVATTTSDDNTTAEIALEYDKPVTTITFRGMPQPFWGTALFWILSLVPFLAIGAVYYRKNKIDHRLATPISVIKQQQAGSEASKRLQKAKKLLQTKDAKGFYNEISKALLGFVADKYNVPTVELTKTNVKQLLIKQELESNNIDTLLHILQTCEMALFAGMNNEAAMQQVYHDTTELIKIMEA